MQFDHEGRPNYRHVRSLVGSLFISLLMLMALFIVLTGFGTSPVAAQSDKQGTVIVQFDDNARVVRGIEFRTPISGLRALQLSGLSVVTATTSFGPAVCSIEGIGCPATACFCNPQRFWSYTYWDGQAWQSYSVGANSSVISQTGAIEGWRWGEFGSSQTTVTPTLAAAKALTWLQTRQVITNGGYEGVGTSVEALLTIGANHLDAQGWQRDASQPSLADFITVNSSTYAQANPAAAGKLAVAVAAADTCLPLGAWTPQDHYSSTIGAYSKQSGLNAWAILGAVALSETVSTPAITYLKQQARASGGWEWAPGWGADTNATALALQALIAAGEPLSSSAVVNGLAFLDAAQQTDGGFAYDPTPGAVGDANSTAYVLQALIAASEKPAGPRWTISNTNPISYLLHLQLPDGSLEWQPNTGANLFATQQAIPALLGQSYPIQRRLVQRCPGIYLPVVKKQ